MIRWPRNDRHEAAAVVLVELSALGGVTDPHIAREDVGDLCHCAIVPHSVLYHVAREEANTAAINAVIDPHGSDQCHR